MLSGGEEGIAGQAIAGMKDGFGKFTAQSRLLPFVPGCSVADIRFRLGEEKHPETPSNEAGFQAGFDFFPRDGGPRMAVVASESGIKETLFLGSQFIVNPIAFQLGKLFREPPSFDWRETRNFVKDFSQTRDRSLIGGVRTFNCHHL